ADDLSLIREDLLTCDICIVAAPTYFANIPACLKNVLDRLVATVMDDNESLIPKPKLSKSQKYILMTTCSTPAPFDRF
ncbi:MAG: NAD(P)H-dependent oxidoreductase, partial [Oscillospiraceae bacterium]